MIGIAMLLIAADGAAPDRVPSFKGLLEMEAREGVSDAAKKAAWEAFVSRTRAQLEYAQKAITRWENAERARILERAIELDDAQASFADKEAAWNEVARTRIDAAEADKARDRARHWHRRESMARIETAKGVENEGASKVDRIRAWTSVIDWADDEAIVQAASKRRRALAARLFEEARALDRLARVDAATKLEAWQAVLDGAPTESEASRARARVAGLSSP